MKNSTLLELQGIENQSHNQAANHEGSASIIDFDLAFTTLDSRSFELFEAQFSDVTCLSTVASRGFTSANFAIESDIHSSYLSGMYSAGVVSAGGWSSPGVDNFASDLNAHGVPSFDGFNSLPTNCDFLQGIGNSDAFIEDLNFGMNEEQVRAAQDKSSPGNRNQIALDSSSRDGLGYERENDYGSYSRREPNGSWAEDNEIIHKYIFSQQSGLEGLQQ